MSRPKRILSAHPTTHRPLSPHSALTFSRKELIQNVYTTQAQTLTTRAASAKLLGQVVATDIEKSKKIVVKESRKMEEMEEEILRLKKTVNSLTEEVCRQKGRTQSMRKKGQKLSKIFTVEFENQAHWTSAHLSSHLVAGIKHTYDQLKAKHQKLQEQHDLLLKKGNVTRELEYLTYIEALEHQNRSMRQKLDNIQAEELLTNKGSEQVASYVIAQLKNDRHKIAQKYKELQGRYQMCLETLKDRNRKVGFLEKLIIEKDNNIHGVHRQNKRIKDQKQSQRKIVQSSIENESRFLERKK